MLIKLPLGLKPDYTQKMAKKRLLLVLLELDIFVV